MQNSHAHGAEVVHLHLAGSIDPEWRATQIEDESLGRLAERLPGCHRKTSSWHSLDVANERTERQMRQDIGTDVEAGRYLDKGQPRLLQAEYGPLGDVENFPAARSREVPAEGDALHAGHDFPDLARLQDSQLTIDELLHPCTSKVPQKPPSSRSGRSPRSPRTDQVPPRCETFTFPSGSTSSMPRKAMSIPPPR